MYSRNFRPNKFTSLGNVLTGLRLKYETQKLPRMTVRRAVEEKAPTVGNVHLTPREIQICKLVADGHINKHIAAELDTTEQVIKNYLGVIYDKTGTWNRTELATWFAVYRTDDNNAPRRTDVEWSMLTERQLEVAKLVSSGMSNEEIGKELGLAVRTVKRHVGSIMDAVGLNNRTQIAVAIQNNGGLDNVVAKGPGNRRALVREVAQLRQLLSTVMPAVEQSQALEATL